MEVTWYGRTCIRLRGRDAVVVADAYPEIVGPTGRGITADAIGNVYASGYTYSSDWFSGGWDTSYNGGRDGFVLKIATIPLAPANPGATAIGVNTITWTWQDNSDDETGFKVYDDPGAGPPVTLQTTTAADVEARSRNGLSANTQYAFQVAATNIDGDSALTPNFTAWTLAAAPVAPLVFNPGADSLDVVIAAGDGNPAYTLYAIQVDGSAWVQADGTVGASAVYQTAAAWGIVEVSGLVPLTEYAFAVVARNGAGVDTVPGPAASGTTLAALAITQHPVGGSAYVDGSFAFSVAASGGVEPLSYQWRRNGGDIPGATGTALVLNPLVLGNAGSYACFVSDSGVGSATSNPAVLDVESHLAITTQPQGANLLIGDPCVLLVGTAGGYPPLTYAWSKDGSALPGATSSSYLIPSFGGADAGAYIVQVGDNLSDVASSAPAILVRLYRVPIAGAAGLAVLLGGCLLAGRIVLRKKR